MIKRILQALSATALSCPAVALAQQAVLQPAPADAPAAPTASDAGQAATSGLTDIVVTAQRRTERLQDVPIAVTALSAAALTSANVRSLQDLSASIPGFVTTRSAGYGAAPLTIRGIGGANGGGNFFADEPVATYVDGVYVGRLSVSTADLVDVDSVQVLRGPQGTLYGRNSTAGAVLIGNARPTTDFFGRAEAGVNSQGDYRGELALSGPIAGESVLGRVAAAYSSRDGYGRNVVTGKEVGKGRDITLRGSLRFVPTDALTIDLIGEHFDQMSQPAQMRVAQLTGGTADSPFVLRPDLQRALKDSEFAFDDRVFNRIRTNAATALIEWRGDAVTINAITGYRTFNVRGMSDADNTAAAEQTGGALRAYNAAQLSNSQFTQELRIGSSGSSAPFTWTAGIFYIHENNDVDRFEIYNRTAFFGLGTDAVFVAHQKLDAVAGYADASYELLSGLTVRGGGRYSYEHKTFDVTQRVTSIAGGFAPSVGMVVPAGFTVASPPTFRGEASFRDFSMRAVVDYKINRDVLAYFNYSQGFKSGGFNAFGLTTAFRPENINAYEVGLKSELFDRLLRLNASAFLYDYSNLQARIPQPTGGVAIQNAASARIKGVELETALVAARGLRLGATAAYLDAYFTEGTLSQVPDTARFRLGAAVPLQPVDISGNRLSRAPKWQFSATADYQTPISRTLKLAGGASYRFQTNSFFLETNQDTDTFRSGRWGEFGLRASLGEIDERWSVTAYADNLFDNRHFTQIAALNAFPFGTVNNPRTFGLRSAYKF